MLLLLYAKSVGCMKAQQAGKSICRHLQAIGIAYKFHSVQLFAKTMVSTS